MLPVYISGYTRQSGKGIYLYSFDPDTGLLSNGQLAAECESPSYIRIHRPSDQLVAVNETNEYEGQANTGYVTSFRRSDENGKLIPLNTQSSLGSDPCYLTVQGQHCLVSNYMGGSIVSIGLTADGFSGKATTYLNLQSDLGIQASQATTRQTAPHAHAVDVDEITHRLAIVMDLGSDAAVLVPFDPIHGQLEKNCTVFEFPKGTGPRHIVFAPNMRSFGYVLGELSNEIFMVELSNNNFNLVQKISALPPNVASTSDMLGAEIDITPNGRFLYATVRGHDSISVFYIDDRTGKLSFVENQSTLGQHPRYFVIDPQGNYLLVANQMSDNIVTFKIDQDSGRLTHVQTIEHPEATCIKFWF